jgi:hypothetical protein
MKAIIKNISKNTFICSAPEKTFLHSEKTGEIKHTKDENKALVFYDEWDAESTLEMLNDTKEDCYSLIQLDN